MYTSSSGEVYVEPYIFIGGEQLGVGNSFVYLEITVIRDGTIDADINCRIAKASFAFENIEKGVWLDWRITKNAKLYIYDAYIVTNLLLV